MTQCDDIQAFARAHKAVQWLAAKDQDRAQLANGLGFSKSDTKMGQKLASLRTERVVRNPFVAIMVVNLARKYRRQLPAEYLVDKPKQPKFHF